MSRSVISLKVHFSAVILFVSRYLSARLLASLGVLSHYVFEKIAIFYLPFLVEVQPMSLVLACAERVSSVDFQIVSQG